MAKKAKGINGHEPVKMRTDEWLTPPDILKPLGEFDLDPCSPVKRPWDTAKHHYNVHDNGLKKEWFGRVWLNPPYGDEVGRWLKKLRGHGNGMALIFARTETDFFFETVWRGADAVLFIEGRLNFYTVEGKRAKANAGAPSVLVAYGDLNVQILKGCGIPGQFIRLENRVRNQESTLF